MDHPIKSGGDGRDWVAVTLGLHAVIARLDRAIHLATQVRLIYRL